MFLRLPGRVCFQIISESWVDSHSPSMVHILSILLSCHSCPMVSSPSTEGKFHPFGVVLTMSLWRVFHVVWWSVVMVSR
jgi:hypothetical protein